MTRFFFFLFGAILGGMIGAATVLLLTPYSGNEVRERVIDFKSNLQKEIQLAADKRREELEAELAKLRKGE